jgi:hypothetical protein
MMEQIKTFIEGLKSNPNLPKFDEAKIKQAIILPILRFLNWSIYDVSEVVPEYSVESRRVDYSLRLNDTNEVFIEAKGAGTSLEDHEEQLLDYAFRQGVEITALTNGITWSLYLPTKKGDWKARKFYTIDIIQQESEDAAQKFTDLLSKRNVESGSALQKAESIYKGRLKKEKIKETLPEAWEKIISEPDTLLIGLIAETTEKLCGFKPDIEDVKEFLILYKSELVRPKEPVSQPPVRPIRSTQSGDQRKKAGHVTLQELVDAGLIRDG